MQPFRTNLIMAHLTSHLAKGQDARWRLELVAIVLLVPLLSATVILGVTLRPTKAAVTTIGKDGQRTGWYPDQASLTPSLVSGGTFGQSFSTPIDGQVYAQPLVSSGTLLVATETNNIYGLDPVTGAQKWTRNLGTPFNPADLTCSDISPSVGITSTPVVDPATNIAYLTSKVYVSGTLGPATYYMHAVDMATGNEVSGFPVQIQGTAANDPTHTFDGTHQLQRPGLLLMNGVVYAGFGAHCDRKPYEGWVVGVSTAGKITAMWTDEAGQPQSSFPGGGIWQSGGGLVSDGPGQIILSVGNGVTPPSPSAGKPAAIPSTLGQSVVRLTVQPDGSLQATDFFSPYDSDLLNSTDSDVGAGAPMALPQQYFGTPTYPHLLVQTGKQGYVYLLNADSLGGRGQGPSGSDAVVSRVGPYGGVWGKPSVWPGDGGYVYITTAQGGGGSGRLKAFHYGLDGSGNPTLSLVGTTADTFGFGSSTPIVTSSGTTSGTALVWVVWEPDGTGVGGQLRAYNPIPVNGTLQMVYSIPVGTASKFNSPAVDNGRVYVGTRDGHVLGFASPVSTPLSGGPQDFGSVIAGQSATASVTLTANANLTITNLASTNSTFTIGTPTPVLPATLSSGQTITVPVTFAPTQVGLSAASLNVATSAGPFSTGLAGTGESSSGQISVAPTPISFGGVTAGGEPASASTTFSNTGATPITVTDITLPSAPFSVSGMPAVGTDIAPNTGITVTLTFMPTDVGSYTDTLVMSTSAGQASVPMSGTAGTPQKMQITPTNVDVGNVAIGGNGVASFNVSNVGGSPLTITISKSPAGNEFTPYTNLSEGTVIAPGATLNEIVLFQPTTLGAATDTWSINSDDGSGKQIVTFTGNAIASVPSVQPSLYVNSTTVVQPASGTATATFTVTLSAASTVPVTVMYTTKDGTALAADGDYVPTSGTLTFNPGDTSRTVSVTVNGDPAYEQAETFAVSLSKPTNAVLGGALGKARVIKTVGQYALSVGDVAVNASSTGTVTANFPVSISSLPGPGETVTVSVATVDGTAKATSGDYVALPTTTVTFTNSSGLVQNVPVTINTAPSGAGNKTFMLNLTSPSKNASIADTQGLATIVNGGTAPPPSISIADTSVVQPTTGTATASFNLMLNAASGVPVTVNYATHDGTATVGNNDYIATSGSVTFQPGETIKTVTVTANGSMGRISGRYFYLNLSKPTNAVLGDAAGRATLFKQIDQYFIYVSNASIVQNATSGSLVLVPVSLDGPVGYQDTVKVSVATANGTAVAGSSGDYNAVPLTQLTFTAGQQTIQVPIFINANPTVTGPKTFTLNLSAASSDAVIADNSATVTILNHG